MECNPSDCSVHGILQARILDWVTIPSPGDLPNPGIEPPSPAFQADSLPSEPPGSPGNNRKVELNALPQVNGEQAHCTARSSSLDENPEDLRSHEIIN